MAGFETKDIRNIAILGHGSEGKTTLVEGLLFAAGVTDRQGRVEDGATVTDFDPEETKRNISISAAVAPIEWKKKRLNIIDVPGYFDFIGEMIGPLRVSETVGILVNASGGVAVGTEKAWQYATKYNVGKLLIVNQMDREHADYNKVFAQLREMFGSSVVPILLPIGKGDDFKGLVNVLENKAYDCTTKVPTEIPVPDDMKDRISSALEEITEAAAAADDELMMKYLEGEELTSEELLTGFSAGMARGEITPVVPCSAVTTVGVTMLLDVIADFLPSPEGNVYEGKDPKTDADITRKCKNDEPFSALIYKTIADPFVGKLSLFKVMSGTFTASTAVYNAQAGKTEKVASVNILRGKKLIPVDQLNAGDLGAIAKLQVTNTGDTLCDQANPVVYPKIEFPEPCISKAIFATKQGEEDKVFSGLAKLLEEDPPSAWKRTPRPAKRWCLRRAICTWMWSRTSLPLSSVPMPKCMTRAFPTVKPLKRPLRRRAATKNSLVGTASSVMCGLSSHPSATRILISSLKMPSSAVLCPATLFPRWKKACARTSSKVYWRATPWLACMQSCTMALTTR